jgi:hypothetical protein
MVGDAGMSRVVTIPDHALHLACKCEKGDQELTMYYVDQAVVDALAYLLETPKDERPKISCCGREWIIAGRVMGSLCYDKRNRQFCWCDAWFVILENDSESMNLIGPLSRFSITIRNAIFTYQETEEKRELFKPWMIEGAAEANGYLIEDFKRLPKYQQRGMLLDQQWRQRQ